MIFIITSFLLTSYYLFTLRLYPTQTKNQKIIKLSIHHQINNTFINSNYLIKNFYLLIIIFYLFIYFIPILLSKIIHNINQNKLPLLHDKINKFNNSINLTQFYSNFILLTSIYHPNISISLTPKNSLLNKS